MHLLVMKMDKMYKKLQAPLLTIAIDPSSSAFDAYSGLFSEEMKKEEKLF